MSLLLLLLLLLLRYLGLCREDSLTMRIDLLAILQKILDRAIYLYIFDYKV